ncbi:MAG: glutathione S-transferase family protein [Sphingobium sp.]|uniref:glutathione S-transferase family protein n=1 Tax=Sphingobium sp. TaxID=1912891 RepID=UPI0029BEEB5B|nr:glutathione S-transferase family protein [Sphingobium sp.]MDX3908938.1 glutathione S-transferase family protein [Sphingobium sp.]
MLTIWGRLNSHNVKKVVWLVDEIGLPYVRHDIGGKFGMTEEYRALNPNALIPTIEDDGVTLWESNAILRYLAARYDRDRFWPNDPAARAVGDKWIDWQFSFAEAQRDAFLNLIRRPMADRNAIQIAKSGEETAKMMLRLNQALGESPWLSGANFGLGDIPMGVYAHTWFTLELKRPDVPNVRAWYDRLVERPAYASTVMIPLT